MLSRLIFLSLLASDSIFLVQGDWHIFHCLVTGFCQFYDRSGERSNRAQEIGHRAAIVGGFASRYRSSFIGDGEPVRILHGFLWFVYHPNFGEMGTLVPSRSRALSSSDLAEQCFNLGVLSDGLVQIPMSLCSACASHSSVVEIALWNV